MSHYIEYERWNFPANKISGGDIHLAASLLSSSLEVNSFSVYVACDDPSILDFKRNSKLIYYPVQGRGMVWRVQSIERTAPSLYHITATSTLGLLTESQHYGGIYTGQTAEEVVKDICGAVPVEIKSNLRGIKLYGWLPIAAARDNLSQVLFAIGAALKSDLDGVLRVETLWDGISGAVGAKRMYQESGVKYDAAVTSVVVTEHQYIQGSEEKSLFEGTSMEGDIITFSEPMHSLTAEGFTILDHDANWAKLSAGTGILRGNAYIHNTREVVKEVNDRQEPNVKTVKEATLVSLVNSNAVANRLKNFYQWRETIDAPIIYRGELPGDRLDTYHPFDKIGVDSCLQSADITLSNTLKAQIKSLVGFAPEQIEEFDYYDTREVITSDQEWVVPDGVESIRAILIGGGQGGYSGGNGEPGASGYAGPAASGGKGGLGCFGGSGGNIFQFSTDTAPGERYQIHIGTGGSGGECVDTGNHAGTWGEETTFGNWSSASGNANEGGFVDPITMEVFATRGHEGVNGADGGASSAKSDVRGSDGNNYIKEDGTIYLGGVGGHTMYTMAGTTILYWGGGGGGGGAALGEDGQAGESATIDSGNGVITPFTPIKVYGGSGGNGAKAAAVEKSHIRGSGGTGGNGGGGGGGGGFASEQNDNYSQNFYRYQGAGGDGGAGSDGGDGADGVVILYYRSRKKKQYGQLVDKNGRMVLDRYGRRIIM